LPGRLGFAPRAIELALSQRADRQSEQNGRRGVTTDMSQRTHLLVDFTGRKSRESYGRRVSDRMPTIRRARQGRQRAAAV
jgi:hypothetical protein